MTPATTSIELHYIELRKFSPTKPHELRSPFERWLYVLKFADVYERSETTLPDSLIQEEGIPMALEAMRKAYARDEVRELIEAREKAQRDWISGLHASKEEGREAGREEGREEVGRRMLEAGLSMEEIERFTGLTAESLKRLAATQPSDASG